MRTNEQLGQEMEALQSRISDALTNLPSSPSQDDVKAVQENVSTLQGQLAELTAERDARLRHEETEGMKAQITNLDSAVKQLMDEQRSPDAGFRFEGGVPILGSGKSQYANGERSFFNDIRLARTGNQKAMQTLYEDEALGIKAMTEGTESNGGFLVQTERMPGLLEARARQPIMRNLVPSARVNTDKVEFVSVTSGLVAGWAAELATKPGGDFSFGSVETSVFTAAGLAVVSNQLLEDSSIDRLIARELVRRVDGVIDLAIVNGTGTGQPRGILQTPGVTAIDYADASPTVLELLPQILRGIVAVQEDMQTENITIVMRPSTWNAIIQSADAAGKYTLGLPGGDNRTAADALPNRSLFGYRVRLSNAIPNTLDQAGTGVGTQTRVIIGDFSEALMLERSSYSFDKSEHVYFTSNQTVFRGEARVGFTAGRYPKAFAVVGGTGMSNTVF